MKTITKRSPTFTAFLDRVLEPLPEDALCDFEHNRLLRQQREEAWRKADVTTRFAQATIDYSRALGAFKVWVEGKDDSKEKETDFEKVTILRRAIADQILTPSPDRSAVTWKRNAAQKYGDHLPLGAGDIERAINEDQAFLTAHPVSSRQPSPRRMQS